MFERVSTVGGDLLFFIFYFLFFIFYFFVFTVIVLKIDSDVVFICCVI